VGVLIFILIVGAAVGGVMVNRKTSEQAMKGVLIKATVPPAQIGPALTEIYCGGARATFRSLATGLRVSQVSPATFRYEGKHGDRGVIEIKSDGNGSLIVARAESLFVGNTAGRNARSAYYAVAAAMVNRMFILCGIAPNAAKVRRFQRGIEGKLRGKLGAAAIPPSVSTVSSRPELRSPSVDRPPTPPPDKIPATRAEADAGANDGRDLLTARTALADRAELATRAEPATPKAEIAEPNGPREGEGVEADDAPATRAATPVASASTAESQTAGTDEPSSVGVAPAEDDGESLWD